MDWKKLLLIPIALLANLPNSGAQKPQESLSLGDLEAKHAVQLSAADLKQLLPNVTVKSVVAGSTRSWLNHVDGRFVAYSKSPRPGSAAVQGAGTWRIDDNGAYCVQIALLDATERWCHMIYKLGDKYFGVDSTAKASAAVQEFQILK